MAIEWELKKTFRLGKGQMGKEFLVPGSFTRPYLLFKAKSLDSIDKKVKPTWRRAGYISGIVTIDGKITEIANMVLPFNQSILKFPLEPYPSFSLKLKPQPYLPNLDIAIWQIDGAWLDEELVDGAIRDPADWTIW